MFKQYISKVFGNEMSSLLEGGNGMLAFDLGFDEEDDEFLSKQPSTV
jgi:hypothetical protein